MQGARYPESLSPKSPLKFLRVIPDAAGRIRPAPRADDGWWDSASRHTQVLRRSEPARGPDKPVTLLEARQDKGWTETSWLWVHCRNPDCKCCAPVALVPLIIRWRPDAPFDWIRTKSVCDICDHRGADTQMPSWDDMITGFQP